MGIRRNIDRLAYPVGAAAFARWLPFLVLGDLALILFDGGFRVAVHLGWAVSEPVFFMVTRDDNLPEFYGYLKEAVIIGALAWAFVRTRARVFAAFAATFLVILADDALQLHETLGGAFAAMTGETRFGPVRMQDAGEIVTWAALGLLVSTMLVAGFWRSAPAFRRLALPFLYVFFALVFVAIGVDLVDTWIDTLGIPKLSIAFGMAEDGSEMLLGSLLCAYAMALTAGLKGGEVVGNVRSGKKPGARRAWLRQALN